MREQRSRITQTLHPGYALADVIYSSSRFLALRLGLGLDASEALSLSLRLRFGFVSYKAATISFEALTAIEEALLRPAAKSVTSATDIKIRSSSAISRIFADIARSLTSWERRKRASI